MYTPVLYILLEFPIDSKAEFWVCFRIHKVIHESGSVCINKPHSAQKYRLSQVATWDVAVHGRVQMLHLIMKQTSQAVATMIISLSTDLNLIFPNLVLWL